MNVRLCGTTKIYNVCMKIVIISTIKKAVIWRCFEVMSDEFNASRICVSRNIYQKFVNKLHVCKFILTASFVM
jgi:hypothetical protein